MCAVPRRVASMLFEPVVTCNPCGLLMYALGLRQPVYAFKTCQYVSSRQDGQTLLLFGQTMINLLTMILSKKCLFPIHQAGDYRIGIRNFLEQYPRIWRFPNFKTHDGLIMSCLANSAHYSRKQTTGGPDGQATQ